MEVKGTQPASSVGTAPGWRQAVVWLPDLDSGHFSLLSPPEPEGAPSAWVEVDGEPRDGLPGLDAATHAQLLELARQVAGDGEPRSWEHEVRLPGGRRAWMRTELTRVAVGPHQAHPIATSWALPGPHPQATRLPPSQEQLTELLDSAPLVLFVLDPTGVVRESRGQGLQAFGRPPGELVGHHIREFPEERPWLEEALQRALAGEGYRWSGWTQGRFLEVHCGPLLEGGRTVGLIGVGVDITERKQAQEALWHSRDELDRILQQAPVGITVLSAAAARLYCNQEAARLTGYPDAPSMCAQPLSALSGQLVVLDGQAHPFSGEEHPALQVLAGREVAPVTLHYRVRTTGEELWVRQATRAVRDEKGQLQFIVSTWQDITHLKRSEAMLRFQHSLLEAQSEASLEGILVVSPDGRILSSNRRFAELWGLSEQALEEGAEALARRLAEERVRDPAVFLGRMDYLKRHPEARSHDEVVLRDGRTFERHSTPLRDPEGESLGRVWFFRDITARQQAEQREKMFLVEQTARTLAEAATQRASFLAEASRILNTSLDHHGFMAALVRRCVPYLADWCVVDLVEPDGSVHRVAVAHADPMKDELAQQLLQGVPDLGEQEGLGRVLRTGQGELREEVSEQMRSGRGAWAPVGTRDAELLSLVQQLGMNSVLTVPLVAHGRTLGALTCVLSEGARRYGPVDRELAEELAARVAQAVENALLYQQSQRAVLLRDRFLSVAAHELRTPLTALELAVRTLRHAGRRGQAGEAQLQQALSSTQRQVVRLERLVESLLDVSRIQADKVPVELQPLELGALVREVVGLHEEDARRHGSTVSVHVAEPVVGVWDRALLEQVLTHLLDNAFKYGAGRPVSVSVLKGRERAVLQVHDEGIGVPEGAEKRIFERFERAVPSAHYGGLGLGLYIVREALERLGGHIQVRSAPGRGSIFTVTLPLRPPLSEGKREGGGK